MPRPGLVHTNYYYSSELRISRIALRDDYEAQPLRDNPLRQRPSEVGEDPHSVLGVFSSVPRTFRITRISAPTAQAEIR
jgi:hypothetical protein